VDAAGARFALDGGVIALQGGKIVYDGPATGLDHQRLIDIYGPEFEDAFWETKA
jgi:phosphonate transport system ATP-binding protein